MTEFEKIQRAKMYLDKLANGVNPIDNTAVAPTDVVRNERVVNCFKYISEVLGKQLANAPAPKKEYKPFYLPLELRNNFEYSDTPIYGSEILRRINVLAEPLGCKKLKSTHFFLALIELGLLSEVAVTENRATRRPTDLGLSIGVILEPKTRPDGTNYVSVLYQKPAQRFIVDNIDAIIDINNAEERKNALKKEKERTNAPLQGSAWTEEQERLLIAMFKYGENADKIAEKLQRTKGGVAAKLVKLGLIEKKKDFE